MPRDDATTQYMRLDWQNMAKLELLAGQHRKLALTKFFPEAEWDEKLWWIVNVYDLRAMPDAIRIDLTANTSTVYKEQSSATTLRDMAVLLPSLARADTAIAFPRLQRTPTVDEVLEAPNKGDKQRIQAIFALHLSACATSKAAKNLNKYRDVLATPMRDELERFCNIGAASDIFTIGFAYDMSLSQCFKYWQEWFRRINNFVHNLLGDISPRHFDITVWEALASRFTWNG